MTLTHTEEKLVNGYNQIMTVVVKCKKVDDFGYDDVQVHISYRGHTMEVSGVLSKTKALEAIVDDIDWRELAIKEEFIQEEN
jgi:hypothetical protein